MLRCQAGFFNSSRIYLRILCYEGAIGEKASDSASTIGNADSPVPETADLNLLAGIRGATAGDTKAKEFFKLVLFRNEKEKSCPQTS